MTPQPRGNSVAELLVALCIAILAVLLFWPEGDVGADVYGLDIITLTT